MFDYNKLRPFEQGYVSYIRPEGWNPLINEGCPYLQSDPKHMEWLAGYTQAVKEKTEEALMEQMNKHQQTSNP